MDIKPSTQAWNNFVTYSKPYSYEVGSDKRSAAIACLFMGLANNGGINYFLTYSCEHDASEVVGALRDVGALIAAKQLDDILRALGAQLPASSPDLRWTLLDEVWLESLNKADVLPEEADRELMQVLSQHVRDNEEFYLALG
jgi:hypothetical protein